MGKLLRVLMVEDVERDAVLLVRELGRGGFDVAFERVETAEAMTLALDRQAWDIIISDYTLPSFGAPQALVYKAARSGEGGFPDMLLAAQAKIFTAEAAIQTVNEALQFFGARGYSRNLPLERMARDVRMFTIGGGTAEVLRNVVAGSILGKKLPQTRDGWTKAAVERG